MTAPRSRGEPDEAEAMAGPGAAMGEPESGTHHASAPDPAGLPPLGAPLEASLEPPLGAAAADRSLFEPRSTDPADATTWSDGSEGGNGSAVDVAREKATTALGVLRDFADRRPELFLAGAAVAGLVAARVLGGSGGDDPDGDE